jgi:hypothetical protein
LKHASAADRSAAAAVPPAAAMLGQWLTDKATQHCVVAAWRAKRQALHSCAA